MKKINKNNLFMYALIVIAVLMLSTTLTMAVLSDNKKGKEDLVFGRVAISGENSCLEFVIDEPITQDSEILNDERYLYFSPTDDTEPMIVRLKVEYQIDEAGYDEQIEILNSTIADEDYFVTYYDDSYIGCGYKYIYDEGYFYMVVSNAPSVELDTMFEIWAEDSEHQFIICDEYIFHLADKASQASVFTNLVSKNLKLVVTIEAAQKEGLESLSDVWEMPEGEPVLIVIYDENLNDVVPYSSVRSNASGNVTLPTSVPSAYSGNTLAFYAAGDGLYAPGSTVNLADIEPIDENTTFEAVFAGMYGEVTSISGDPVGISEMRNYTWQEMLDMGIFTVVNNELRGGTGEYQVYASSLQLPYNITTIKSSAFNQYGGQYNELIIEVTEIELPGNLVTIEPIDTAFLDRIENVTMFDKVENVGNFFCNYLAKNKMLCENGIYYIGSGNNPYFMSYGAKMYDENDDWGYSYPDGFNINSDTKFVSVGTLINYITIDINTKTNLFSDEYLEMTFPTDYEICNLDLLSMLYEDIVGNLQFTALIPFVNTPFLTHEDGIVYLSDGDNDYYAVVLAYGSMTIPENTPGIDNAVEIDIQGIDEETHIARLNSNTEMIIPGAFACVHSYTLDPEQPFMFSLELNPGLTRIEDYTFANTAITGITIPASVEYIGYCAFASSALTTVQINQNNTHYTAIDNKFIVDSNNVLIGYTVNNATTEITIPSTVTSIAVGAFSGCTNLTTVTIPSNVLSVTYLKANGEKIAVGEEGYSYLFGFIDKSNEYTIIIDSVSFITQYAGNIIFKNDWAYIRDYDIANIGMEYPNFNIYFIESANSSAIGESFAIRNGQSSTLVETHYELEENSGVYYNQYRFPRPPR